MTATYVDFSDDDDVPVVVAFGTQCDELGCAELSDTCILSDSLIIC